MVRIKTKYSEEYDISRIKFYAQIHYKVLATYSQGIFWANIASLQSTFYNISNISASKTYIYRYFSWNTLRGFFFSSRLLSTAFSRTGTVLHTSAFRRFSEKFAPRNFKLKPKLTNFGMSVATVLTS